MKKETKNTKPRTRRKTASPRGGKKKTAPAKKSWGKKLLSFGFKCTLVVVAVMGIWGIYLDSKIQERFDGQIWQLPAVVYGRILHLAPGESVTIDTLKRELDILNYKRVRNPSRPGEYSASRTRVEIIRRPFEFEDGPEQAQHVMISFSGEGVQSLKQLDSGKQLGYLRIEPKLLGTMESNTDEQRIFLPRERFPEFLVDALLTTEDRDFYHHDGVAPLAIVRALVVNLKAGRTVQGGSTLTQQLAKNVFLTRDRTLWRKAQEAYIAVLLDYRYSKDRLLEAYLNEVYLGQARGKGVHGFPLGARLYFGRPIEELSIDQLALLVGIVKGPSYYNPWRYPERVLERRDLILRMMMENGVISSGQYAEAAARKLGIQKSPSINSRQPAYFEQLTREIRERVGSQFNPESGLRVFSTLDPLSQSIIDKTVVNKVKELKKVAGKDLEAAVVIADRQSGEIRAMVGGSRPGFAGFNRALNGSRQIGSLSKPAVYLAALSVPDKYNLASPLDDKPIVLKGDQGSEWKPRNYDRKFRGQVPLLKALAHSYNIPTVNLGLAVGLGTVIDTYEELGVDPDQITRVPSLLLGTFTLTPIEVTQMFQTIGSGGRKADLTALRSVVTRDGQVLYRNWPKSSQTVPKQASWLTMYAMKEVVRSGTGRYLNPAFGWAGLAGKTGTTDNNRDSWYVGIDGREVVTVWLGRDDNKSTKLTGSSGALRLYADYIKARKPEPLVLNWPSELASVPYQVREGQFVTDCFSDSKLPVWDPKGHWRKRCDKPEPVGWLQSIFN
ncbi:penicillin-binding protein 1B [Grimontia sp. NTOU-MAR1]|uniref:penicillin-binding protein 1B n=1 Tax=Grimontia sp. NTOU-MAR1 TaxID=3111011 RepID=UPI002DB5A107|nr:penicillin-binding protein 1B [Grimontia sp. NTOU-MAR1]WRV97108.1 penicillin-binding protein 1B [Grimontia sp. NTOU-MAR1]